MPELPDLEVAKKILNSRIKGMTVEEVELRSPVLLRRPTAEIFCTELTNRIIRGISRYGKFLIFRFRPSARLYLNLMLAGRITLQPSSDPKLKKLGFQFRLANHLDLRYNDVKNMGKIYLLLDKEPTSLIPTFDQQGPDALDPNLTLERFQQRIRKFHAVIKHVLVNQRFIAGLGNAYSDEILYVARIAPFRKRNTLTDAEIKALYQAMNSVLRGAISTLMNRAKPTLGFEVRDFLQVHGKAGQPCPTCGQSISSVKSGIRVANFCRHCQT